MSFHGRTERLAEVAMPVITKVYEEQGHMFENILVPITDGRLVYNIRTNLKEAYETGSKAVVRDFEKAILLHNIDDAWKENLRELDELKKSVQNASYEQKDPLSTLMRGQIPVQAPEQVQEAAPEEEHPQQRLTETHEDVNDNSSAEAARRDTREQSQQPIVKDKMPGRNDLCPCGSGKKFKNCHGKGLA